MKLDPTIDTISGKRYVLRVVAETRGLKHVRMEIPDMGRLQSTDIIITPEFTVVTGDVCPGRNGAIAWKGEKLLRFPRGASYLADNFLETGWHQDLAHVELDEMLADEVERVEMGIEDTDRFRVDGEARDETARMLHGLIGDGDVRGLADWFTEHGFESEEIPGWGHKPIDVRVLSLINLRYSALVADQRQPAQWRRAVAWALGWVADRLRAAAHGVGGAR